MANHTKATKMLLAAAVLQRRGQAERAARMFLSASRDPSLRQAIADARKPVLSSAGSWPFARKSSVLSSAGRWPFAVRAGFDMEEDDVEADMMGDLDAMGLSGDDELVMSDADEFQVEVESGAEDEFEVEVESGMEDEFEVEVESSAGDEFRVEVESASDDEDEDEDDEEEEDEEKKDEEARFVRAFANLQRRDQILAAKKKAAKKPAKRR